MFATTTEKARARDSESREIGYGSARSDTGEVPRRDDGTPATEIKDETPEAPRKFEHVNSSLNAGRSEPTAETENRSELELLRDNLREKYPQEEGSHNSKLEERAVPTAMGKAEAGQEADSPSSEDARSELERLRKEIGERGGGSGEEVEPIPRKEDGASTASLEKDERDEERGKNGRFRL